jgi:hypothetical protein
MFMDEDFGVEPTLVNAPVVEMCVCNCSRAVKSEVNAYTAAFQTRSLKVHWHEIFLPQVSTC